MEKPRPSTLAWAGLVGGVALYDILSPKGETLSEGFDRLMDTTPGKIAAIGSVALVATHLLNILPQKYDPIHRALFLPIDK